MKTFRFPTILVAGAAVVALVVGVRLIHRSHRVAAHAPAPVLLPSDEPKVKSYIAAHAGDPRPAVQDAVATERMRLGYLQSQGALASSKDAEKKLASYESARKTFLTAEKQYKGAGIASADFGSIPDQAAYQAAVCLVAEGKTDAAKAEFLGFLKDRPLSPLCKACYRRLVRLNGGKVAKEYDALFQKANAAQEKHVAFEMSVCGPKAIATLLPMLGKPKQDYKEIAKLCGTTDRGTTVEGMRKGLKALGLQTFAVQVNVDDFSKLATPAILLSNAHYVILTKIANGVAECYDPTLNADTSIRLPKADDPNFLATVITFSLPSLGAN